jgi:hypothetical protein
MVLFESHYGGFVQMIGVEHHIEVSLASQQFLSIHALDGRPNSLPRGFLF